MRFLRRLTLVLALSYIGICALMFFVQRSLQYHPDASPMNPLLVSLPRAASETVTTSDGEKIIMWWIAPRDVNGVLASNAPVYLYFHGNGANLHARAARFAKLTESGAGLLAVSWRGYGGSSGSPTEAGLRLDARAAYDALVNTKRVNANRIVMFGESLGTTVATILAAEVPSAALALDSSFDSALDVAQRAYPWLPVRYLLLDTYRADLAAPNVRVPVQQFHCSDDFVTPLASAQALHARFANARKLYVIEGRCHVPEVARFSGALNSFIVEALKVP